ncbi:F-box protein CPR1-like [Apium graveolens]|uniref:F-box protein CPR1-like n=1 Tax=Apium graveolens TaxID=4045 RepID=UPI003D7ABA30
MPSSNSKLTPTRSLTHSSSFFSALPRDLFSEILTRLNVKTLTRLKSVCKPWRSLVTTRNFIKQHLAHAQAHPENQALIVHSLSNDYDDVVTVFRIGDVEHPVNQALNFPQTFFKMELVGSISGIVCLCDRSLGFMIVVWNPATRECKMVPFPNKERHAERVFVGFGYDSVEDDFRVVCVFRVTANDRCASRFYVYSCNAECWKAIRVEFPYDLPHMWCVVTVKGNPYWMGFLIEGCDESNGKEVCVMFDVRTESFRFLDLPKCEMNSGTSACLANYKDMLADMLFSPGSESNKLVDVFILDEKSGAWSKIYTVGPIPLEVQRVLHCFKNGEIVVEDEDAKLFLYDPKSKEVKNLRIDNAKELNKAFCYTESLVTIKKTNHVEEEDSVEASPSTRKRDDFLSKGFKLKL